MNVFGAWMQDNWYQLGSFFVQFAFLCAAIWFARRILRTLRASQEQVGALLKLSFYGTAPERTPEISSHSHLVESAPSPGPTEVVPQYRPAEISPLPPLRSEANSYWLPPTPSAPATSFVTSRDNPLTTVSSGHGFTGWLKSPMTVTAGSSPFHRVLRWLQSPAST
jgi:hypothetical protein